MIKIKCECGKEITYWHPTCSTCELSYLSDEGYPSKVIRCKITGEAINPMGYCHCHSELEDYNERICKKTF